MSKYVFVDRFPCSTVPILCLLRRRVRLSREVTDDVVRAHGYRNSGLYVGSSWFNGLQHGLERGWHTNGHWEMPYVDDKPHGLSRGWYKSGSLHWETLYVGGNRHGLSRGWYENGARRGEVRYVDGKAQGRTRWWCEDGSLEYTNRDRQHDE